MLQFALRYARLGLNVIPVTPRGKVPLIPWIEFQKRRPNEEEIKEWFQKWPDANIGLVTGSISGLVVVDLDGPEGLESAKQLNLGTNCAISLTGKGKHLCYRYVSPVANSVRVYPGIDIRGDGGFVLAPPSVHPNGKRYRWLRPVVSVAVLPLFPAAVFASTVLNQIPDVKRNEPGWISQALEGMTNGNIDDTLFRICSRMRNDGYTQLDCLQLLQPHAERVGADPGHLQDKITNVWGRYEPSRLYANIQPIQGQYQSNTRLVLHNPTNPDSINEFERRNQTVSDQDELQTGYPKFDTLSKGLKAGEVLTVAARTGIGKTNWIITPIRTFCESNKKVLLFSTEMSFDQIWQRYRATLPIDNFGQHSFYICDEFTPNIERIEEAIRHVNPDLFVFDHISHIATDYHVISRFMSEIKRLARLFNIPVIVTAQLNRNADWVEQGERVEPRLSMIQGSDQIGQMSAQVLLLNEKRINGDMVEIEGLIVKNRHGDKGMIQFALVKNPYRMVEL